MIPPFDHNNVLPPFLTSPSNPGDQSPYRCEILEFCQRFATSAERKEILKGFIQFRIDCNAYGIKGIQWIDGSFVENVEISESRNPRDIDVVSLILLHDSTEEARIMGFPEFVNSVLSKSKYHVDHYPMVINDHPSRVIAYTKYWISLFCHNRKGVWKGMLEIPIYDTIDKDLEAMNFIKSL